MTELYTTQAEVRRSSRSTGSTRRSWVIGQAGFGPGLVQTPNTEDPHEPDSQVRSVVFGSLSERVPNAFADVIRPESLVVDADLLIPSRPGPATRPAFRRREWSIRDQ